METQSHNWSTQRLSNLLDYILEQHHGFLRQELPRIERLFDHLTQQGAYSSAMNRMQKVFADLKHELESHLFKEENVLFPFIRHLDRFDDGTAMRPELPCTSLQNPIRQMEFEHEHASQALRSLRKLSADYTLSDASCQMVGVLVQSLRKLDDDLARHIHLENNILFPRALTLAQEAYKSDVMDA